LTQASPKPFDRKNAKRKIYIFWGESYILLNYTSGMGEERAIRKFTRDTVIRVGDKMDLVYGLAITEVCGDLGGGKPGELTKKSKGAGVRGRRTTVSGLSAKRSRGSKRRKNKGLPSWRQSNSLRSRSRARLGTNFQQIFKGNRHRQKGDYLLSRESIGA